MLRMAPTLSVHAFCQTGIEKRGVNAKNLPQAYRTEGGDVVFSVESSRIKFGCSALREVGYGARSLGMTHAAIFTNPNVAKLEPVSIALDSLKGQGMTQRSMTGWR